MLVAKIDNKIGLFVVVAGSRDPALAGARTCGQSSAMWPIARSISLSSVRASSGWQSHAS
jgi:hypothetical protein